MEDVILEIVDMEGQGRQGVKDLWMNMSLIKEETSSEEEAGEAGINKVNIHLLEHPAYQNVSVN